MFEEYKENMLQEFRKKIASQQNIKDIDQDKSECIKSFAQRLNNQDFCQADSRLLEVHKELLKLHNKNEVLYTFFHSAFNKSHLFLQPISRDKNALISDYT